MTFNEIRQAIAAGLPRGWWTTSVEDKWPSGLPRDHWLVCAECETHYVEIGIPKEVLFREDRTTLNKILAEQAKIAVENAQQEL